MSPFEYSNKKSDHFELHNLQDFRSHGLSRHNLHNFSSHALLRCRLEEIGFLGRIKIFIFDDSSVMETSPKKKTIL